MKSVVFELGLGFRVGIITLLDIHFWNRKIMLFCSILFETLPCNEPQGGFFNHPHTRYPGRRSLGTDYDELRGNCSALVPAQTDNPKHMTYSIRWLSIFSLQPLIQCITIAWCQRFCAPTPSYARLQNGTVLIIFSRRDPK